MSRLSQMSRWCAGCMRYYWANQHAQHRLCSKASTRQRHIETVAHRCSGCGQFLTPSESWLSTGTTDAHGRRIEARYHRECWTLRNPSAPATTGVESTDQREAT